MRRKRRYLLAAKAVSFHFHLSTLIAVSFEELYNGKNLAVAMLY